MSLTAEFRFFNSIVHTHRKNFECEFLHENKAIHQKKILCVNLYAQ